MDNGNEDVVAWLESSLGYARDQRRAKLTALLESVRDEIVWEADFAEFACGAFSEVPPAGSRGLVAGVHGCYGGP